MGYEAGGPYELDHFKLTKGRTELRAFLWSHWHAPCSTFHSDSLVRFPVAKPGEDYPSQTLGPYLPDKKLPETLLTNSEVKDPKYYKVILVAEGKAIGSAI